MEERKNLPMFPSPYPGECLYSIFCRYHQRSGNHTDTDTILQLFGRHLGLNSSVLTPFRLNYYDRWYSPDTPVSRSSLMMEHTAYPYYSLFNWPWRKEAFLSILNSCEAPSRTAALLARDVSSKTFLCYCPECANEDRKLYGETYWHILPQINGVEYCLRHKCRILRSPVRLTYTKYHFVPANPVLGEKAPRTRDRRDSLTIKNYLDLAEDSEWMMRNGTKLDCYTAMDFLARDACAQSRHIWHYKTITLYNAEVLEYLRDLVVNTVSAPFLQDMLSMYKIESLASDSWKFVTNCYAVRLIQIRLLYGSVENLYNKITLSQSNEG